MTQIYLDHACTSFPKAPGVADAVYEYMTTCGASVNRGCYSSAYRVEEMVYETRELLAELFGAGDCRNVVFTKNSTEALNVLLKGFLHAGDHVLVSSMEHNAVMRPLVQLAEDGVCFDRIPCRSDGTLCVEQILSMITPKTRAIVLTHASNVCGTVMPLPEVGAICRDRGLRFLVDASQTAGVLPIHMDEMCIDALAFTGHKGLMGPQGIGGLAIRSDMVPEVTPLLSGGTGSFSHLETVPSVMPDLLEPGTPNLPGILGLRAALLWIRSLNTGDTPGFDASLKQIHEHELNLTRRFLLGLRPLETSGLLRISGICSAEPDCGNALRTSVVSVEPLRTDPAQAAFRLDEEYGIQTRVGLHCAPSAHRTLGSFPRGSVRFSFGFFNTAEDVDAAVTALREVCNGD